MKKFLFPLFIVVCSLIFSTGCRQDASGEDKTITIRLISQMRLDSAAIFITGNADRLGKWQPAKIPMEYVSAYERKISLSFNKNTDLEFTFTRGSFSTEAVGPSGVPEEYHRRLKVTQDTVFTVLVPEWMDKTSGHIIIPNFNGGKKQFEWIVNGWKFHPGDDPSWALPNYPDTGWEIANTFLSPDNYPATALDKTAWFRLRVKNDSADSLCPLMFSFVQVGKMELFFDGHHIYSMNGGIVTDSTGSQCSLPVGFPALDNKEHLLAVRYQKNDIQKFFDAGFSAGFGIQLGNANYLVNKRVSQLNEVYYKMILFGIIPLILASFHLIIFFFNHNNKQNLFYGLCMIGFAGIVFAANIGVVTNNYTLLIIYNQASYFFENMAIVFGLLLMYSFTGTRTPRHAWFIIFIAACLTLFAFRPFILSKYQDIFLALVIVEMVRKAFFTKNEGGNGSYVILIGFLILVVSLILQLLIVYDVIPQFFGFGNGYLYGALSLGISMSIHLSLNFAKINKDLQKQLRQISDLSEKTLAQERDAHRKEIEQRLLEADHARKTEELDGARQLQLSMLPTTLPVIPGLDIAVYLNTATEVGGDYYDFHLQENGTLTVAVGDATGHGVKAGILVAVTKGLFHEMASISDIPTMFRKLTTVIKTMNLGQLFMSMALLKLQKETFTLSSAGMPPVLVYRAKEGSVEEIRLKGMPLGAFANFNYTQISNSLFPGDALVIMSDGFPEMFNQQKEQFGFERTKSALQNVGTKTAEQIISHFTDCTAKWLGSESQADDITFVVIKKIDQPTE